jgi:hypothetical protein
LNLSSSSERSIANELGSVGAHARNDSVNVVRFDGFEIVDNDQDVVHPFNRHILFSLASLC